MTTPLVSIVTPSYNQARWIEETIRSVLDQDYPAIEYIVVDGGSTDGSADIIKTYADRLAYWVSEPDRGQSHAINKGWQRATGEVVAYLNSDDLYTPGAVRTAVNALLAHPDAAMVYGDVLAIDTYGRRLGVRRAGVFDLRRVITTEAYIPQSSVFIRRTALDRVGLLDESLHYNMDYDLWVRLGVQYPAVYLPGACLSVLREHPAAKSTADIAKLPRDRRRAIDKIYARADLAEDIRRFRGTAYASTSFQQAAIAARAGRTKDIWMPLLRAVIESPAYVARRPFALYVLLRALLPWWDGGASTAVWKTVDRAVEHLTGHRRYSRQS